MTTLNLEVGHPTVEETRQLLRTELEKCRNKKVVVLKVIHGYGSSGVGGALRQGIRKSLVGRKKEGIIRAVLFGENWNIFDATARLVLEQCPALGRDKDLGRSNPGISLVLL